MDVGAHLRSARERRAQTLEQVSEATKLSTATLRLIERNQWERLPGGLLTRGHLRAYARVVGVDPEDVVHEYLSQLPPEAPAASRRPAPLVDPAPSVHPLPIAVIGLALAYGTYSWLSRAPAPIVMLPPAMEAPAVSERPLDQPAASDPMPAIDRVEPRLLLEIDATGPCWLSARADGQLVVYRLLAPGEGVTVAANAELLLRVGNPGSFRYTLNGVSGRSLGDGQYPVTVTITAANVESFLAGDNETGASSRFAP